MISDIVLLQRAVPGDECPLCRCGTVEFADGYVKCRGECGAAVELCGPQITDALTNEPSEKLFRELVNWLSYQATDMNAPYLLMAMARFIWEQFIQCAQIYADYDAARSRSTIPGQPIDNDPDEWMGRMMRAIMDHATSDVEALRFGRHLNEDYNDL